MSVLSAVDGAVGWSETPVNLYKTVERRVTKNGIVCLLVCSSTKRNSIFKCITCTEICVLPQLAM